MFEEDFFAIERDIRRLHERCRYHTCPTAELRPTQFPILILVCERGGCSQRELADELGVAPATVAVSLKRLERGGFIRRCADRDDARSFRVYSTEAGCEWVKRVRADIVELNEVKFRGFSPEEREEYLSFMRKIRDNLADYCDSWERNK